MDMTPLARCAGEAAIIMIATSPAHMTICFVADNVLSSKGRRGERVSDIIPGSMHFDNFVFLAGKSLYARKVGASDRGDGGPPR